MSISPDIFPELVPIPVFIVIFADLISDSRNCYSQSRLYCILELPIYRYRYRFVKNNIITGTYWRGIGGLFRVCLTIMKMWKRQKTIDL
jgi:hypothetical protein